MAHLFKEDNHLNHPPSPPPPPFPQEKTELENVGSQGVKVKRHKGREKQKVMPSAKGKKKTKP